MDLEATDQAQAQMGAMWETMLGQMTASGATRMEIAAFAADTAHTILRTTRDALWPQGQPVPPQEARAADQSASGVTHLGVVRSVLQATLAIAPDDTGATASPKDNPTEK